MNQFSSEPLGKQDLEKVKQEVDRLMRSLQAETRPAKGPAPNIGAKTAIEVASKDYAECIRKTAEMITKARASDTMTDADVHDAVKLHVIRPRRFWRTAGASIVAKAVVFGGGVMTTFGFKQDPRTDEGYLLIVAGVVMLVAAWIIEEFIRNYQH